MKILSTYQGYVVDGDYRKYVGPRWAYDKEAAWQFMIMSLLGLREYHSLLEIAAGSLRAARLFIPYLRPGKYCAVEAQEEMVRLGIANEVGEDQIRLKRPEFIFDATFSFEKFRRKFDYILAHRILCHLSMADARKLIQNAAKALADEGLFVGNYNIAERDSAEGEVAYGVVTGFTEDSVKAEIESAGLAFVSLPFKDRRSDERWFVAVRPQIFQLKADSLIGYLMTYWQDVNERMGHTDA